MAYKDLFTKKKPSSNGSDTKSTDGSSETKSIKDFDANKDVKKTKS